VPRVLTGRAIIIKLELKLSHQNNDCKDARSNTNKSYIHRLTLRLLAPFVIALLFNCFIVESENSSIWGSSSLRVHRKSDIDQAKLKEQINNYMLITRLLLKPSIWQFIGWKLQFVRIY